MLQVEHIDCISPEWAAKSRLTVTAQLVLVPLYRTNNCECVLAWPLSEVSDCCTACRSDLWQMLLRMILYLPQSEAGPFGTHLCQRFPGKGWRPQPKQYRSYTYLYMYMQSVASNPPDTLLANKNLAYVLQEIVPRLKASQHSFRTITTLGSKSNLLNSVCGGL